jgi:hypothetical protein
VRVREDWQRFTVVIELKDGSMAYMRTEVDVNLSGKVRIHDDHNIDRSSVVRIVGSFPGWRQ